MGTMVRALAGAAMFALAAGSVHAQNLISNGNFETGNFSGWSTTVQAGSSGNLYINGNGNASPQSGFSLPGNPNGGNFYAMTDQGGPGSYALTQSFTLSSAGTVHFSFDLLTNNTVGTAFDNGRDFGTSPNQNATVDILTGSAGALTNDPNDIVGVLFGPGSNGDGWQTYTADLALGAGTYTFRFAETDNQGFFQAGLDNVSITGGAVPEPASWALMLGGFGLVGGAMRRRRAAVSFA